MVDFTALSGSTIVGYAFSTGNGYMTKPDDFPGNVAYSPRIINPGLYERHLWQPGTTSGAGSVSAGVIELANSDGKLDTLQQYDVDKRSVTVRIGDDQDSIFAFKIIFRGTIKSISWTPSTCQINIYDTMANIAGLPMVTDRYGGTNNLPNGVDGTSADLIGQFKPLLIGEAENFAPPIVNTSQLIYQISNRAITNVYDVWEGGAAVTLGSARSTLATLQSTAPAAGTYDYYLGTDGTDGAYLRLGSSPGSNALTCRAADTNSLILKTAVARVMTLAGVAAADVSSLANLNGSSIGHWVGPGGSTVGAVLDTLCIGIGASWVPNRAGAYQLQRLVDPQGYFSTTTITPAQILSGSAGDAITIIPSSDTGGVPPYQYDVGWGRNYTTQKDAQVAGSVTDARRAFLGLEYRRYIVKNSVIWDPVAKTGRNPLSVPFVVDGLYRLSGDAFNEATRLSTLFSPTGRRRTYLSFSLAPKDALSYDLGSIFTLKVPRFGFDGGINMLVVGMIEDHQNNRVELFCWG